MQELLDKFIRHLEVERGLSPYTVRNYSTDVRHFLGFLDLEEVHSLEEVDQVVIRNYLGQLLSDGTVRASISRKMSALRSFFRFLNREGILRDDPLRRVSGPRTEKRLPSFLTSEEIISLLNAPDTMTPLGLRDRAILELLYASGLRVSEIVSVNVRNLDLESRQMRVWGKGSKERMVLMGEPAALAVKRYLDFGREKLLREVTTDALFLNRHGRRLAERGVQYLLKRYARQAGVSGKVHPHMLRHTFATHMLDGGADLRVVQDLLGHTSLASTQIYTHVTRSQMRSRYLEAHPRSTEKQRTVSQPEPPEESEPPILEVE